MPWPEPSEEKNHFIARFMCSAEAQRDYPERDQRIAVAESTWREKVPAKERTNATWAGAPDPGPDRCDRCAHEKTAHTWRGKGCVRPNCGCEAFKPGEKLNALCSSCGAQMSGDPDRQTCTHCGEVDRAPTPAVEDLPNICRECSHPMDPEHDAFGCHLCDCVMTQAPIMEPEDALGNAEDRPIEDSDIQAAQRGLNMLGMSVPDLRDLIAQHQGRDMFASKVIVKGAEQMLAAKRRMGAAENANASPIKAGARVRTKDGPGVVAEAPHGGSFAVRVKLDSGRKTASGDDPIFYVGDTLEDQGVELANASKSYCNTCGHPKDNHEPGGQCIDCLEFPAMKATSKHDFVPWREEENANGVAICHACMAVAGKVGGDIAGKKTITKDGIAHIVVREGQGHVEVACGDESVCECQNAAHENAAPIGTTSSAPWMPTPAKGKPCMDCGLAAKELDRRTDSCKACFERKAGANENANAGPAEEAYDKHESGCATCKTSPAMRKTCPERNKLFDAAYAEQEARKAALSNAAGDKCPHCGATMIHGACTECDEADKADGSKKNAAAFSAHCAACNACENAGTDPAKLCEDGRKMVEAGNADDKGPFDQPNPMGCNGCDDSRAPLNKHGYCQPCAKKQGPTLKNAEEPVTVIPATPPAPGHKIPPPPAGLKVAPKPAGGLPYPNGEKDNAVTACACTHPATAHEGGEGPCRECSCQAYREGDEAENAAGDTPPHMRIDSREWAKQHDTKTGHDVIIPEKSEPWCKDCGATWNYSEQKEVQNAAHPAMEAFEAHLKACNACSSEYANAAPDPAKLCEDGQRLLTAGANENSERRNALPAPLIAPTYTDLADAGAAFWGRTP